MTKSQALTCIRGTKGELVLLARLGLAAMFLMAGLSGVSAEVVQFELQSNLANGRLWIDTAAGTVVDSDIIVPYSRATPEFPRGNGLTNVTGPLSTGVHRYGGAYIAFYVAGSWGGWERLDPNLPPVWYEYASFGNRITFAFEEGALVGLNRNLEFVPFIDVPNGGMWMQPDMYNQTARTAYIWSLWQGSGPLILLDSGGGRLLIPEPSTLILQTVSAIGLLGVVYRNRRSRRRI